MVASKAGRKRVETGPLTLLDSDGKEISARADKNASNALKSSDLSLQQLIKEVVTQLKINNQILNEVHDLTVNELDIK